MTRAAQTSLAWLAPRIAAIPTTPLSLPPILSSLARADAMAEGDQVGIGGWVSTKHGLAWFAEAHSMEEIRAFWPFLTKDAQKYIACFETLAQLALAMTAKSHHGHTRLSLCLPTESDNTPTEGGVNKLFTTSWPLSEFLSLVASWSSANGVTIQVSHIAGAHNEWADDLSRGRLQAFAHRSRDRFRVSLEMLASASAKASWSSKVVNLLHRSVGSSTCTTMPLVHALDALLESLLPRCGPDVDFQGPLPYLLVALASTDMLDFRKTGEGKKYFRLKAAAAKKARVDSAREKYLGKDDAPKPPPAAPGAYQVFVQEKRPTLQSAGKNLGEVAKEMSQMWGNYSEEDRKPYEQRAAELKAEYEDKMKEYKQSEAYKKFERARNAIFKKPKAKKEAKAKTAKKPKKAKQTKPKAKAKAKAKGKAKAKARGRGKKQASASDSDVMGSDSDSDSDSSSSDSD
ncbi:High mobility group protein B3 [Symbiodinium microadriaticum]|uniref:High mobility group protein B3 n=1 Tax=Symbiodinium microadriaticum TaxID=2951 RepID=A0A1Q9E8Z3_SYMMI|nr:High mobility group protein B3 [Symbiodinium microadriaticum]